MNDKSLKVFENKLLAERERLIRELDHLDESFVRSLKESSGDLSAYSLHMADLGSDAFEREMNYLCSSTEGRLLIDTIDALRRIYRDRLRATTWVLPGSDSLFDVEVRREPEGELMTLARLEVAG